MIQFVPVKGDCKDYPVREGVIYLDDCVGSSMTLKYDYAVKNYMDKDGWYCFRHNDLFLETPINEIEHFLETCVGNNVAVCGVIGTLNMEMTMTWWNPHREVNGAGSIKQTMMDRGVPIEGKSYEMNDWVGYHEGLATVDGCVLFIHSKLFKTGASWDTEIPGYHYYDVDICLQALERGFSVATIPIVARHDSAGIVNEKFFELGKKVFEKWSRKVHGIFPINRFSIFHDK